MRFDPSRWIVRLYLMIVMIVIIMMITGCGHHYYSSDDPKYGTDTWVEQPCPEYPSHWCYCQDRSDGKHCRPI